MFKSKKKKDTPKEKEIDWPFDAVLEYFKSPKWRVPIFSFFDEHCIVFENEEENSFEYTRIHDEFKKLVEDNLAILLEDIGISEDQLAEVIEKAGQKKETEHILEQMLWVDNFLKFKECMIRRNRELNEEVLDSINRQNEMARQKELAEQHQLARQMEEQAKLDKKKKITKKSSKEEEMIDHKTKALLKEEMKREKKEYLAALEQSIAEEADRKNKEREEEELLKLAIKLSEIEAKEADEKRKKEEIELQTKMQETNLEEKKTPDVTNKEGMKQEVAPKHIQKEAKVEEKAIEKAVEKPKEEVKKDVKDNVKEEVKNEVIEVKTDDKVQVESKTEKEEDEEEVEIVHEKPKDIIAKEVHKSPKIPKQDQKKPEQKKPEEEIKADPKKQHDYDLPPVQLSKKNVDFNSRKIDTEMFRIMGKDLSHTETESQSTSAPKEEEGPKWVVPPETLEERKARLKAQRDRILKAKNEQRQKELSEFNKTQGEAKKDLPKEEKSTASPQKEENKATTKDALSEKRKEIYKSIKAVIKEGDKG